jgi:hypothetical protein
MLKHYNEKEVKSMAKSLEEAESMSNKPLQAKSNMTTKANEGPIKRSRAKELIKQKVLNLYSDVVRNTHKMHKVHTVHSMFVHKSQSCTSTKYLHQIWVHKIMCTSMKCMHQNLVHKNQLYKSTKFKKKSDSDQETDQMKTDTKKDGDPNETLLIKKRLHKAKRTLEDIQNLNIKQWTSLKNSVEKETKTWKKCLIERIQEPHHLGPSLKCDQYGLPRLEPGCKQPVWVHNRRKNLQS